MVAPSHQGAVGTSPNLENSFGQTVTLTKPSGLADGETLWAIVGFQNNASGAAGAVSPPAGWVSAGPAYTTAGDVNLRPSHLFYKTITNAAGEAGTYAFTTTGASSRRCGAIGRLQDVNLYAPILLGPSAGTWYSPSNDASQSRAVPAISTTVVDSLVMAYVHWQTTSTTTTSSTWGQGTERFDIATISTGTATHSGLTMSSMVQASTGSTGTMTATLSGSGTVANGSGYLAAFRSSTPQTTSCQVIAHRGIYTLAYGAAGQAATAEETTAGLAALVAAFPKINGIEIDARLSSDGVPFLCHDTTLVRTYPAITSGGVADYTSTALDGYGVQRLDAYMAAAVGYGFSSILVQHYTATGSVTQLQPIVNILNALPANKRSKIIIMTDNGNFSAAAIRTAGWAGRIGSYGMSAANWATYQPLLAASAAGQTVYAFTDPGDAAYITNRSHIATIQAAGFVAGGSTVSGMPVMDYVHADGCGLILTDDPGLWLACYNSPGGVVDDGDTMTSTDALASMVAAVTASETLSGADTIGGQARGAGDTLTGTDAVAALAAAVAAAEALALADVAAGQSRTAADTLGLADAVSTLLAAISGAETLGLADAVSALLAQISAAETLAHNEGASVDTGGGGTVNVSAGDTLSLADAVAGQSRTAVDALAHVDAVLAQARGAVEALSLADAVAGQSRAAAEAMSLLDLVASVVDAATRAFGRSTTTSPASSSASTATMGTTGGASSTTRGDDS